MLFEELLKDKGINCPIWLEDYELGDAWKDSKYSKEGKTHKWRGNDSIILFDGVTFSLYITDPEGNEILVRQLDKDGGLEY